MSPTAAPVVRASRRFVPAADGGRRTALVVLVAAVTVLLGSVIAAPWIAREVSGSGGTGGRVTPVGSFAGGVTGGAMMGGGRGGGVGGGMMGGAVAGGVTGGMMGGAAAGPGGPAMMSGRVWLAGDGVPVTSIAAARARASAAAGAAGLRPGEIVQFTRNVYVELKDAAGASVTEVLVDPTTGAVVTEPGPATMWNTGSRGAAVSPDQARSIATTWLQADRPGETVTSVDAYPGYYTLDTAAGGKPVGMLSVQASTGAVWYHTWHGAFVAREDS